jgi:hypothetical protein
MKRSNFVNAYREIPDESIDYRRKPNGNMLVGLELKLRFILGRPLLPI